MDNNAYHNWTARTRPSREKLTEGERYVTYCRTKRRQRADFSLEMMKVRKWQSSIPRHSGETQPRILYPAKIHFKSKGKIKTLSDTQAWNCLWYTHTTEETKGAPQAEGDDESVREWGSTLRGTCAVNGDATSKKCNIFVYLYKRKLAT